MAKNLHKNSDWTARYKLKLAHLDYEPSEISNMKNIENIDDFKHIHLKEDTEPEFDIKVDVRLVPYVVYVNDNNDTVTLVSKSSLSGRSSPFTFEDETHQTKIENIHKGNNRRYSFVEVNGLKYPIWSNLMSKKTKIGEIELNDKGLIDKLIGISADNTIDLNGWRSIGFLKRDMPDERILQKIE